MTKTFSQKLKTQRKKNNFTQSDLAVMLDVSRTCISNWESGLRVPDFVMISRLSAVLNVPVEYFIKNTSQTQNSNIGIDVSKLNQKGKDALIKYYRFLLTDENMIN